MSTVMLGVRKEVRHGQPEALHSGAHPRSGFGGQTRVKAKVLHLELEKDDLPRSYTLLRVRVPQGLAREEMKVPEGEAWKSDHDLSRKLGDAC